jgi:hypothetical protein
MLPSGLCVTLRLFRQTKCISNTRMPVLRMAALPFLGYPTTSDAASKPAQAENGEWTEAVRKKQGEICV